MKTIQLLHDLATIVDDDVYEQVAQLHWYARIGPTTTYVARFSVCRNVFLHHFVLPKREGFITDHVDGDGLNNQRSNLRYATYAENARNARKFKVTSSVYKGVSERHGKWIAAITYEGRMHRLGTYDNEVDAAIAYNIAAIELFGAFARIN